MQSTSATSEIVTVDTPMAELYPPDRTCEYAIGEGSYVCRVCISVLHILIQCL